MDILVSINWISLFALTVVLLLFTLIKWLKGKLSWTKLILLSLVLGIIVGVVFSSEGNSYLVWVDLIGKLYVRVITYLVGPVIALSIISGFISLKDGEKIKSIGVRSVFWLLASAAAAILLSIFFGLVTGIGKNASSVFENISSVSQSTVGAYSGLTKSFDDVILSLFPENIVGDLASNNVTAIILASVAIAAAYIKIARWETEEKLSSFVDFIDIAKKVINRILKAVIKFTPYAVLSLIAGSASTLLGNWDSIIQLLLLVSLIYLVALIHGYVYNGLVLKAAAKVNPVRFFRKTFQAQTTAFTTQSSVGTLPVTISNLVDNVGVSEEVANFTAPLGTTIGMPGCTCIWPVLLAIFYINASGLSWGFGDYLILAVSTLLLSLGSAGVPGIAIVSAIALFGVLDLPIAAVILLMPINTISDMVRTFNNVTSAAVATAVVARKTGNLDDSIFNKEDKE